MSSRDPQEPRPKKPRREPVPPLPAASLLLLRDAHPELQVLMQQRHHEVSFATGAVVFPGGKVEETDRSPALRARCSGATGLSADALALRAAAIRETFEESGILLARERGSGRTLGAGDRDTLAATRGELAGGAEFAAVLTERDWLLACDELVPYAHWITPLPMPKRFDTHFFLARAPDQEASHDGRESVDSIWIGPRAAMRDAERGDRPIMFPQLRNIEKLRRASSTDDALARAAAEPVVTVLPRIVETESGRVLRIPEAAGYDVNEIPFVPPKNFKPRF